MPELPAPPNWLLVLRLDGIDLDARPVLVRVVPGNQIGEARVDVRLGPAIALRRRDPLLRGDFLVGRSATGRNRGRCRRAAAGLAFYLRVGVQVLPGIDNLDAGKARGAQQPFVLRDRDRAGDTSDVGRDALGQLPRQGLLQGDVADRDPAAGLEHAEHLAEHRPLVRGQVDHAVADDAINRRVRQRELVDRRPVKLDVGYPLLRRVPPGPLDHGGGYVDAHRPSRRPPPPGPRAPLPPPPPPRI